MKRVLLVLLFVLVVLLLIVQCGKQPEPLAEGSKGAAILAGGDLGVTQLKTRLVDSSRALAANGDFSGESEREFDVFIWTPSTRPKEPQPLVIYSHGFMSNGEGGDYLGEHLASLGYTVAAATYPLTTYTAPGGANAEDVVNQPADVSFIIDNLLARNADSEDRLYQTIDPKRIAAAGLSLGGMTTKIVAYHPLNADKRIVAAISIAGPAQTFSKRFFADRTIPFMMVASPIDAMITYNDNAVDILEKVPGGVLVTINGASHSGFSSSAKWLRWMDNPDSIGCDALMENIDLAADQSWYEKLGTADIGVMPAPEGGPALCQLDPLPMAMNPLRQHQLNTLAVSSFLQCHFSENPKLSAEHCDYLYTGFEQEIAEVTVSR